MRFLNEQFFYSSNTTRAITGDLQCVHTCAVFSGWNCGSSIPSFRKYSLNLQLDGGRHSKLQKNLSAKCWQMCGRTASDFFCPPSTK